MDKIDKCTWLLYNDKKLNTYLYPKEHTDIFNNSSNNYIQKPKNIKKLIKYCQYCGKEIDFYFSESNTSSYQETFLKEYYYENE